MVLKSGTKNLHVNICEFNRNLYFAATNPFAPHDAQGNPFLQTYINMNNFGGTLGGPVNFPHISRSRRPSVSAGYEASGPANGNTGFNEQTGTWGGVTPQGAMSAPLPCGSSRGVRIIDIAWHHTAMKKPEGVFVNLAFNRDSPWLKVVSSLPYERRIDLYIHNAPIGKVRTLFQSSDEMDW